MSVKSILFLAIMAFAIMASAAQIPRAAQPEIENVNANLDNRPFFNKLFVREETVTVTETAQNCGTTPVPATTSSSSASIESTSTTETSSTPSPTAPPSLAPPVGTQTSAPVTSSSVPMDPEITTVIPVTSTMTTEIEITTEDPTSMPTPTSATASSAVPSGVDPTIPTPIDNSAIQNGLGGALLAGAVGFAALVAM
ncbi:hypothetical protein FQN50_010025 [Emmonsiellopsis sp. PD_5]|nr:hypothetical protein FQN50_010025 [Emmonsiellopsis sp. PD_5]